MRVGVEADAGGFCFGEIRNFSRRHGDHGVWKLSAEAAREAVGGVFRGECDAVGGGGFCVDGVGFGGGAVGSAEEALEAVVENEGGGEGFGNGRGYSVESLGFGFGFF